MGLLNRLGRVVRSLYEKAEDFIEDERDVPLSEAMMNEQIKKFVTDNVEAIDEMRVELFDDWCRLYVKFHFSRWYMGLHAHLSTDLKLVQLQVDEDIQRFVFEQISDTRVIEAIFDKQWQRMGFTLFLWWYRNVLQKDPLGFILEKLGVVEVRHDLIYLDIHRWLVKSDRIMGYLRKMQINHAILRQGFFVLKANLKLDGILGRDQEEDDIPDADNYRSAAGMDFPKDALDPDRPQTDSSLFEPSLITRESDRKSDQDGDYRPVNRQTTAVILDAEEITELDEAAIRAEQPVLLKDVTVEAVERVKATESIVESSDHTTRETKT